jgi:hypothetical protein
MTEQSQFAIGTVAQEAARLIEDMATMARSSSGRSDGPSPFGGGPAQEPAPAEARRTERPAEERHTERPAEERHTERPAEERHTERPAEDPEAADEPAPGVCSACGGERDDTAVTCRLCPLCRGVALLRSVRPETVDLLADLAVSIAASLREVATRARAADPGSSAEASSQGPRDGDRAKVQDIPVEDESEGCRT